MATTCHDFLQKITGEKFYIKWPNDLYWCDRKTGGILIENKYMGENWNWAVIGIGINVNQTMFSSDLSKATSLRAVSGKDEFEPRRLASELHEYILEKINTASAADFSAILDLYNLYLYKKGAQVKLKKENAVFSTTIRGVDRFGQLQTKDSIERSFNFGEVEWIFNENQ